MLRCRGTRRSHALLVVCCLLAASCALRWFLLLPGLPGVHALAFDRSEWRVHRQARGEIVDGYVRGQMVRSLMRRYRLVGISRPQVLDLLGEPDERSEGDAGPGSRGHSEDWYYFLGPPPRWYSEEALVLTIGPDGRVKGWMHFFEWGW